MVKVGVAGFCNSGERAADGLAQDGDSDGTRTSVARLFPMFILGFVLLAAVRSVGDAAAQSGGPVFGVWSTDVWQQVHQEVARLAGHLLAIAMAGVGLGASYRGMRELGAKPFYVGLLAASIVEVVGAVLVLAVRPTIVFWRQEALGKLGEQGLTVRRNACTILTGENDLHTMKTPGATCATSRRGPPWDLTVFPGRTLLRYWRAWQSLALGEAVLLS